MAVYGNMLAIFPELLRSITVWTAPNETAEKQNERVIRGAFLPTRGDKLEYQKYSNRGRAIQYFEDDHLFVGTQYADKVAIGDFFYDPDHHNIHRILGEMDLQFVGGYICFATQRVTGTTIDHTEKLNVKEAEFA